MKIIVLNSLSHSGSTVISMVLSNAANAVSLGEIYQVLRDDPADWLAKNETCSCANALAQCTFWEPVLAHIKTHNIVDIVERYRCAIQHFEDVYGPDSVIIDTSKGTKHLDIYKKLDIDFKLVYLLRDVRSFAFSQSKVAARQTRKGLKKIKGHAWFQFLKWYFGNKGRMKMFAKKGIDYCKVGYEDFCFNQEARLKQMCEHTELDYKKAYLAMSDSQHHVLMGNPMRKRKDKQTGIRYDSTWLQDNRNIIPSIIFPFVLYYNAQHVYQQQSKD